ncbi:MAG TPA: citrate/2-methylcitrate synthase, partial [Acidimicrobiales bacterium]|nr:citrate/2-methylcitrate synthase [Acidimicrobiales bacterium]
MATRTVADVMTTPALTATEDEALAVAAKRMNASGVGSVVVVEGNRPVGILTERDLLRAAADTADPLRATVREWMTPDPDCVTPDTVLDDAWRQLGEHGYRHIPVVAGGEFKGIVSMRDLVAVAALRPAGEPALVAPPGLKGVIVAETALGDVRGTEGFYHYRQYSATELAERRAFEDVWHLMLFGDLPSGADRDAFAAEVAPLRLLPSGVRDVLPALAAATTPMAGLRTAMSHLAALSSPEPSLHAPSDRLRREALRLTAAVPTIVAALHRLRLGEEPVAPRADLGHAAGYLYMLTGQEPSPALARALEQYLILALDHGFNASTFTSRVVTSTGADLGGAIVAALSALSGPLHGGAIDRALETLDAIGTPDRAAAWVRDAVERGETIMGFGHPVYRTADPRSVMLRSIARSLGGPRAELAVRVETEVERSLA